MRRLGPVEPFHEHDCDACLFLLRRDGLRPDEFFRRQGKCDVYVCPQGGYPTGVMRWSSDPPDYGSMPDYIQKIYAELRKYHGEEGDEIVAIAKSYLRDGKHRNRKWRSDFRRKRRREERRALKSGWLDRLLAETD